MKHIKKYKYFPLENLTGFILTSSFIYIRKKFNCRERNRAVDVMQMRQHNPVLTGLTNFLILSLKYTVHKATL